MQKNPHWVEALNTLLDDNKVLVLESGKRIPLPEKCSIIFELDSCDNFSPAFVSRCGVVNTNGFDINI
jgi:hypothetical protein